MDNSKSTPIPELRNSKPRTKYRFNTDYSERGIDGYKDWFSFYPKKSYFKFSVESYGYFDPRPPNKNKCNIYNSFIDYVD